MTRLSYPLSLVIAIVAMGIEKYKVSLIPHDLRREETIQQYADELNYLEDVSKDIFRRYLSYVDIINALFCFPFTLSSVVQKHSDKVVK